jgi:hypothetical protein
MARTYTWQDALTRVASYGARATEDSGAVFAMNEAQNLIWESYHWRETLKELPPFWIIDVEQDYGAPTYAVPTDFLSLTRAYLINVDGLVRTDLDCRRDIQKTRILALPTALGYAPETETFRVWPRPPYGMGPMLWLVEGVYKFRPTKVTVDNMGSSLLPWDDRHFAAVCAALHWALTPTMSPNKDQLLNVAMGEINLMAMREGLADGDPHGVSPDEGLVPMRYSWGWVR